MPDKKDQTHGVDVKNADLGKDVPVGELVGRLEAEKITEELEVLRSAKVKSRREFMITIASLSIAAMAVLGPMASELFKYSKRELPEFSPAYARFMVTLNQSARQLNATDKSDLKLTLSELEKAYYELEPHLRDFKQEEFWSLYNDYLKFCRTAKDVVEDNSELNVKERSQHYTASFREVILGVSADRPSAAAE
jgi:hypothetical protein